MKYFLFAIVFSFTSLLSSQNDSTEVVGSYYISSGNPEGGTNIIVMPNNTFVVGYFGGMRKGTWKKQDGKYIFTYHVEPQVVLYARNNLSIKDSVSVQIGLDGSKDFALRFNASENTPFTPIFNENPNCFSYPYVHKLDNALNTLDVLIPNKGYDNYGEIIELNKIFGFKITEDYNEFIVAGLSDEYSEPGSFLATYENKSLVLDNSQIIKKRRSYEDLGKEDLHFVKQYTQTEIFPKLLDRGSEFFPYYENPSENELLPFTRIESKMVDGNDVELVAESLFFASCED